MEWYVFAFACAFVVSLAAITEKRTLIKEHAMEFSTVLAIFNFILSIPLLVFADFSIFYNSIDLLILIYCASLLGSIAFLLIAKSMRHMDISRVSPLLNFSPAVVAVLAFVLLGEKLTLIQIFGIVILMIGAYLLESKNGMKTFSKTMKEFTTSKYIFYIVISFFLYGLSSIIDKYSLGFMTPVTYLATLQFFIAINFIVMISLFHNGVSGIKNGINRAGKWIFLVAVFTVSYRLLQLQAVSMAYVSLVIPIKKLGTLFSTIIGGKVFHEKDLLKKGIACLVMLIGVYLIVI